MEFDEIGGIKVDQKVLNLFKALHVSKGKVDDKNYEKRVLDYYNSLFLKALKIEKLSFECELTSIDDIEKALKNINQLLNLREIIIQKINNHGDFTKFKIEKKLNLNIVSDEFTIWLDKTALLVRKLPDHCCAIDSKFLRQPFDLISKPLNTDFQMSHDDIKYIVARIIDRDYITELHDTPALDKRLSKYNVNVRELEKNNIQHFASKSTPALKEIITFEMEGKKKRLEKTKAMRFGEQVIDKNDTEILNVDIIINTIRNLVQEVSKLKFEVARNSRRRGIWGVLGAGLGIVAAITIIILLFVFLKPDIYGWWAYDTRQFDHWRTNLWRCLLVIVGILLICGLGGFLSIYLLGEYKGKLSRLNIIPKGILPTFVICSVWCGYGSSEYFAQYSIGVKVIGTGIGLLMMIVENLDLIYEFAYAPDEIMTYQRKYHSNKRYTIFFSTLASPFLFVVFILLMLLTCFVDPLSVICLGCFAFVTLIAGYIFGDSAL